YISALIICLIILLCWRLFSPQKLLDDAETVQVIWVTYEGAKITVDSGELISILEKYSSKITLRAYDYIPYQISDVDIEIHVLDDGKPKYILLGEFNIWYHHANFAHNIIDGDRLRDELLTILQDSE
ncbi:MAG: hypothetical protein AAGU75_25250, partial [Bacillota bacterium]